LIDGCGGFAIHRTGEGGFSYKISSPAGIFTAELTALFVTLRHIGEANQPPQKCLILIDSLISIKALLSKKMRSDFLWDGVEFELLWILSHVRLEGDELVDELCCF
jgi:hypothetical protein